MSDASLKAAAGWRRPSPSAHRRTVVLHPGALGDVLLSVPALRRLRASGGELVLAAQPRIGTLLTALRVADGHRGFDTLGLETLFGGEAPPDRLRRLLEGARVVSWFGSADPGFAGHLRGLVPGAIVASTTGPAATVWEHLIATVGVLSPVATVPDVGRDAIVIPPAIVAEGRRALTDAGWNGERPLVLLHPGAGGATKRWATEAFAEVGEKLVDRFGVDLVVHEGPADHEAVAALAARLRMPTPRLSEPSLETLAGAMRHAAAWIGNDSGVTHLAAAIDTPTLGLFAPANLAWRPWAPAARVRVVSMAAPSRADVEAVVADAAALLGAREAHGTGARGHR